MKRWSSEKCLAKCSMLLVPQSSFGIRWRRSTASSVQYALGESEAERESLDVHMRMWRHENRRQTEVFRSSWWQGDVEEMVLSGDTAH